MVGINTGFLPGEAAPFGGAKQSGIGREGSRRGIDEFVEVKYLAFGGELSRCLGTGDLAPRSADQEGAQHHAPR